MTFGVTSIDKAVQIVQFQPLTGPAKNLDTLEVQGTIDPKPYLTGIFIECVNPNNALVLADIVDVPANGTSFSDSFILGAPANTPEGPNWITGTYTFKLFWNPNNGPGLVQVVSATFEYQA